VTVQIIIKTQNNINTVKSLTQQIKKITVYIENVKKRKQEVRLQLKQIIAILNKKVKHKERENIIVARKLLSRDILLQTNTVTAKEKLKREND